jgi:hypothetical protein
MYKKGEEIKGEDDPDMSHDIYEEVVLNYDAERKTLFKQIMQFIDDFSG